MRVGVWALASAPARAACGFVCNSLTVPKPLDLRTLAIWPYRARSRPSADPSDS